MIEKILTIGAYGFNGESFMKALKAAGADLFLDIRARRGMRGRDYAFANASRLEAALADAGIRYVAAKEVAPSEAVRSVQHVADAELGVAKRDRTRLGDAFVSAYQKECLSRFDSRQFIEKYCHGAERPVLFCVERESAACHRSLVAERIATDIEVPVENIEP